MKLTIMRTSIATPLAALALAAGWVEALEVYRIGGADRPRVDLPEVNYHQLQWSDLAEQQGLDEEALARGVLRPLFMEAGENIALTSLARDGGTHISAAVYAGFGVSDDTRKMTDGDPGTFYNWVPAGPWGGRAIPIALDLGGLFHISRFRLFTFGSGHYPDRLDIATYTAAAPGLEVLNRVSGNVILRLTENVQDTIDVEFPPALARSVYMVFTRTDLTKEVKVAEIEVYGEGYIDQAFYVGKFIDLGEPAIWGDLKWGGRIDPQAKIWIQSRTGQDLEPNVYWRFTGRGSETSRFKRNGNPLDAAAYRRLKPGEAAGITYDIENWSFWSPPYAFADSSGTSVLSPSPNSVFQLRVDFSPTAGDGGELEFVELIATKPPLAEDVRGEIYPPEVPLGQTVQLTYAIQPTIRTEHSGFDRIEISAPFGLVAVDSVKVGGVPVEFTPHIDLLDSTFFAVQLSDRLEAGKSGTLVEVLFRAPVLRYSTEFAGWVRDTSRPLELAQRINPGDAARELRSETLSVRTTFLKRLLADLQVAPASFTPNGDGINETVGFSFNLLQLTGVAPLKLLIFDLSGQLVRVVHEGAQQSGRFSFTWDGMDIDGQLVPPGLYVYRVSVEAEKGVDREVGTIAVVY